MAQKQGSAGLHSAEPFQVIDLIDTVGH